MLMKAGDLKDEASPPVHKMGGATITTTIALRGEPRKTVTMIAIDDKVAESGNKGTEDGSRTVKKAKTTEAEKAKTEETEMAGRKARENTATKCAGIWIWPCVGVGQDQGKGF